MEKGGAGSREGLDGFKKRVGVLDFLEKDRRLFRWNHGEKGGERNIFV